MICSVGIAMALFGNILLSAALATAREALPWYSGAEADRDAETCAGLL